MGLGLFLHAARMVFTDLQSALRISAVLYVGTWILALLVALALPFQPETPGWFIVNLIVALLYVVAFAVIAVAWHRYILLGEPVTSAVPSFHRQRLLGYIGYSLLIGLILVGIIIVVSIVAAVTGAAVPLVGIVLGVIGYIFMLIASYRLSPILVAVAVDQRMSLGEAWARTAGANTAIIILAIVSVVAAIVIDLPALVLMRIAPIGGLLAMAWTFVTGWVKLMVGVSIVTTLYGHYVEGRSLQTR